MKSVVGRWAVFVLRYGAFTDSGKTIGFLRLQPYDLCNHSEHNRVYLCISKILLLVKLRGKFPRVWNPDSEWKLSDYHSCRLCSDDPQ